MIFFTANLLIKFVRTETYFGAAARCRPFISVSLGLEPHHLVTLSTLRA